MGLFRCFGGSSRAKDQKSIDNEDDQDTNLNKQKRLPSPPAAAERKATNWLADAKTGLESSGSTDHTTNAAGLDGVQIFSYEELKAATDNFSDASFLGQGGFGAVYKGHLQSIDQDIAVKKLDLTGFQGEREFLVETLVLKLYRHPNIVRLFGYCAEGNERLLVYEYMPLGSLEYHLHDLSPNEETLDWFTRLKIAAGAAKGVCFLHREAKPPVICRDLKSSNILLGDGFYPKLSDFGLAKFGPEGNKTHVSTRVMGTYGYCAPEYAATGKLTMNSDIYSFGIILLELITGHRALDNSRSREDRYLVDWVRAMMRDSRDITTIADARLEGQFSMTSLKMALDVALRCLRDDPALRPTIKEVEDALTHLVAMQKRSIKAQDQRQHVMTTNREQAVAEAKMWGETWRGKRLEAAP